MHMHKIFIVFTFLRIILFEILLSVIFNLLLIVAFIFGSFSYNKNQNNSTKENKISQQEKVHEQLYIVNKSFRNVNKYKVQRSVKC